MRLTELFDRPLEYAPLRQYGAGYVSWFYVGDNLTYVFEAARGSRDIYYTIYFSMINGQPDAHAMKNGPFGAEAWAQIEPEVGSAYQKMTGVGNSIKVISTVVNVFREFMEKHRPQQIQFAAKTNDKGRVLLYRRLARMAGDEFNYSVEESEAESGQIDWDLNAKGVKR